MAEKPGEWTEALSGARLASAPVAAMLKAQGYHTAAIGKWHLGRDWARKGTGEVSELGIESREQVFNVDYAQPIKNGVTTVGFDYFYGISASLDMAPYTYIENDRVTVVPTVTGLVALITLPKLS